MCWIHSLRILKKGKLVFPRLGWECNLLHTLMGVEAYVGETSLLHDRICEGSQKARFQAS